MTQSLSVSSQFADEEVKSSYEDPKGYKAQPTLEENLADIEKELKILREFPNLIHSDYDRAFVDQIRRKEVILPKEQSAGRSFLDGKRSRQPTVQRSQVCSR